MRAITKGPEPPSLVAHRHTPHCDYVNYPDKAALREALVTEQRGICCYCMGRIRADRNSMKIEHWQCRENHQEKQLNYSNLLGSCKGGDGQRHQKKHCDTKKGKKDLKWNPSNPDHHIETRVYYEMEGAIRSDDEEFDGQLDQVLNLNLPILKNNRKGVLQAVIDWWQHERVRRRGPVPRERFEAERNRRIGGAGELEPYCQVAIWWIDLRLARMQG